MSASGPLSGKVAPVTGASSGIGEATALALAEAGAADRRDGRAGQRRRRQTSPASLRQEVTARGVRVSLVEPGAVATELSSHITQDAAREQSPRMAANMRTLQSEDTARASLYVLSQPPHMAIDEVLVRPPTRSADRLEPWTFS